MHRQDLDIFLQHVKRSNYSSKFVIQANDEDRLTSRDLKYFQNRILRQACRRFHQLDVPGLHDRAELFSQTFSSFRMTAGFSEVSGDREIRDQLPAAIAGKI